MKTKLTTEVVDHCWKMYQQGQISADHTDKEVFAQTLNSLANWLATTPASAQAVASDRSAEPDDPMCLQNWLDNACYLLDTTPGAVRHRPGMGGENLLYSLISSYISLRDSKAVDPAQDEQEPVARILHWHGPSHLPVPHGGIAARTYVEFPKSVGVGDKGYWGEGEPLYTRPQAAQDKQEPVAITGAMPGTSGFTMACFKSVDVPVGTPLYTLPQAAQPDTLRAVLEVLRQYPDFDGDNAFGTMIDEALAGKVPSLTAAVDSLAAGKPPAAQVLPPMGEGNEWYFDCDGHYIDVVRDSAGKYSVFFRNHTDGSEAFYDQAQPAAQVAVLTKDALDGIQRYDHTVRYGMDEQSEGRYIVFDDVLTILAAKSQAAFMESWRQGYMSRPADGEKVLEQIMRPYGIYDVAVSNAGALQLEFIEIGKQARAILFAKSAPADGGVV